MKKIISSSIALTLCLLGLKSTIAQPLKVDGVSSKVKTSLNLYSFNKVLTVDKSATLENIIDYSASAGFDAIDITAYFFPGYPNIPSDEYINKIKKRAFLLGLDISGTGVKNDFTNPDPKKRAEDIQLVKNWIDVAEKLGAPVIRVFSGPIPKGYENKRDVVEKYLIEALTECAKYGEKKGVLVGVQNHGDFLQTADQVIRVVKGVNSKWFGTIVDTGYFLTKDPYQDIAKVMPYAVNFQVKESPFGPRSPIRTDLNKLLQIVKESGYRGYLPIETLEIKGEPRPVPDIPYDAYKKVPPFLKDLKTAINKVYQ
ncbi:Xylose isomerase domain-containing protein TIM barrel [Pseudopedobacter saltans DSM 12145]|uniref:Xylose isomerase domain-containing protein TIM barrel n=1 Tax=Pseudopedobacter saltans (strain ATCC 51119 / DSM 12145 / JCM 21818 / CCUG 39354 / LMG 10337 / NBRC 100064 / NCIMB 13643) TaxID=762903 RepID=F0SBR8_PSESL|nr:sugar phosphate isomerase/epimerase family protein [Pseudopedobacter saltans]ADY52759.1 Xylose isomerase domain-containing protein TIM barrel [Pseudopedobacter saltans DSM 12145]